MGIFVWKVLWAKGFNPGLRDRWPLLVVFALAFLCPAFMEIVLT
jgi:hypothetical protein